MAPELEWVDADTGRTARQVFPEPAMTAYSLLAIAHAGFGTLALLTLSLIHI